jgi:hypothetical protein
MEASDVRLIEKLFFKKIMLYDDLLYCFKAERESLISIDLDKLWKIAKEKENICNNINVARQEIMAAVDLQEDPEVFDLNRIMDIIPKEFKAEFQKLYLRLIKLKSEIEVMRKENMVFVDDSLQFLDGIIAIITGSNKSKQVYNDKCHFSKSRSHSFLSREV